VQTDETWEPFVRLTDGQLHPANLVFTRNGRKIVFDGSAEPTRAIYWMDADGQNIEKLTNSPTEEWNPSLSPNGRELIFSRGGTIFALDLASGSERTLFKGSYANFSPDGQWIVFMSGEAGNAEIYKTPANLFAPVNLTNHPAQDIYPAFSPDGEWIVFVSFRDAPLTQIYKMRPDGTEPTRLTVGLGATLWRPIWSPSGKEILFNSNSPGSGSIYRMGADGRNPTLVAQEADDPAWFDPEFIVPFAVSPAGKAALTWGELKRR